MLTTASMRFARCCALIAVVTGCATSSATTGANAPAPTAGGSTSRSALRQFIDSLIDVPEFRSTNWGVLVVDPGRGETLYARNADKLFMPASNQKLLTGSTALTQLGPDYRWSTTVLARGPIRDGELAGSLIVRGNGDPSMSAHMQRGDALAPMRAIADSLRAHGVTRIDGPLVAQSLFTDGQLGYGWSYDDLDASYSAGVDGLYFNEGFTEVVVYGGARAGDPVRAITRPASTYPRLIIRATTADRLANGATVADTSTSRAITVAQDSSHTGVLVSGTIAAGDSAVVEITFRDLGAAYLAALREALTSRGIVVAPERAPPPGGATISGPTTTQLDSLFTLRSPTLREVLPFFEKPSQNQIGEILFKTLALEKTGVGRADSASRVVSRQLIAWGAQADGFAVRDGSGLSRHDYVSPRTIVTVLDAMRKSPNFKTFYDALPIAGVDGTIRSRMRNTAAMGNVHAKTGTLDKARSLSGYVTTADGRMLLFSALCNNYVVPTRRVDMVSDALGVRLASMRLDP
ncbi:MAG: D-alanyl-D-alanine carboxypeptidase/D-alanyl-D-alanine-endopeptidase [Gemmatimonadetes bacterium]|nr:D-alanyl-D-alanine carboxypeptidase/D-alanyl-D-alanine-endopeptidase [Gemmatimonadota bacterium]